MDKTGRGMGVGMEAGMGAGVGDWWIKLGDQELEIMCRLTFKNHVQ